MLIRVIQLVPTAEYDGWDYYENKYDVSSYSDQYSTGWQEVNEEKLKELQKAVGVLNGTTALRYAIIRAYNEVDVEDLINSSEEIKKAQIKTAKAREEALKKSEAARAEKAKARKLKQLEKLKKELNEA